MPERKKGRAAKPERRQYVSRGVEVVVEESPEEVSLTLNGQPIEVSKIAGEYHSQLANQFVAFPSIDDVVDELLRNEGRYWVLEEGGQEPEHPHHHGGGG